MKKAVSSLAVAAVLVSGCATASGPSISFKTNYAPQIDTQGVDQAQYQADLKECRDFAEKNPNADADKLTKKSAAVGGAAVGGLMALSVIGSGGLALIPMAAGTVATTAGLGAVAGGVAGKAAGDAKYEKIVNACLTGRGYKVLG